MWFFWGVFGSHTTLKVQKIRLESKKNKMAFKHYLYYWLCTVLIQNSQTSPLLTNNRGLILKLRFVYMSLSFFKVPESWMYFITDFRFLMRTPWSRRELRAISFQFICFLFLLFVIQLHDRCCFAQYPHETYQVRLPKENSYIGHIWWDVQIVVQ